MRATAVEIEVVLPNFFQVCSIAATTLDRLGPRIRDLSETVCELPDWLRYWPVQSTVHASTLDPIVDDLHAGGVEPRKLHASFRKAYLERILLGLRTQEPEAFYFERSEMWRTCAGYRRKLHAQQNYMRHELAGRHAHRLNAL
ncbi:MAG: hypothetical protein GKS00_24675 [Alphaproteobacteria bacterium]|nr:hypothetical protein [Alphaproteobacteria bacterium]